MGIDTGTDMRTNRSPLTATLAALLLLFCTSLDGTDGATRVVRDLQVIPPQPGYIPVYIRKGDQPLEEINLELAAAFRALEPKTAHEKISGPAARSHTPPSSPPSIDRQRHHEQVGNNQISNSREIIIPVIIQSGFEAAPDPKVAEIIKKKILEQIAASEHIQKITRKPY